jgi:hypothetical protein
VIGRIECYLLDVSSWLALKRLGLVVQIKRYHRCWLRFPRPSITRPAKPIRLAEYFQEPCERLQWFMTELEAKAAAVPR